MDKEKLVRRLKKLLTLAERGTGGEKQNAQRMLDNLLAKYNLTLADITDEAIETHWFKFGRGVFNKKLVGQVIYAVCAERDSWTSKGRRFQRGVDCTQYERAQIQLRLDAYRQALSDSLDLAYDAFIQVNRIFPDSTESKSSEHEDLDLDYLEKLSAMAGGMTKTPINEALPSPRPQ